VQSSADPRFTAPTLKLCWDDARIVKYQHIALSQKLRKFANMAIGQALASYDHQHPRGIAGARRTQRYAFRRKLEIEQVNAHGQELSQTANLV
jgi:hypothetical protein